jgi:hypothetical protein
MPTFNVSFSGSSIPVETSLVEVRCPTPDCNHLLFTVDLPLCIMPFVKFQTVCRYCHNKVNWPAPQQAEIVPPLPE